MLEKRSVNANNVKEDHITLMCKSQAFTNGRH
jgi:hypothetical protein